MAERAPKRWVYVVGAGASDEFGLPTSALLRDAIASILSFDRRDPEGYDPVIERAFSLLSQGQRRPYEQVTDLIDTSNWVARSIPLASSIDSFIDNHSGNDLVEQVGKLAIGRAILRAEAESQLAPAATREGARVAFGKVQNSWLAELFRLIASGIQYEGLVARLEQIALVVFNYDRCIEHFMHQAFAEYFGIQHGEASEVLKALEIHHPYGHLGPLPGEEGCLDDVVPFGLDPSAPELIRVASRIRTFTEGTDLQSAEVERIRELLREAANVVFLGFGFNPQNMHLLLPGAIQISRDPLSGAANVFGTVEGKSESDVKVIKDRLSLSLSPYCSLRPVKCGVLFREYSHTFGWR